MNRILKNLAMPILMICFAALPSRLSAESARIPDSIIAASVVQLRSSGSSSCATGFVTDSNHLITNFHVYDSLCPAGICTELKVLRSPMTGSTAVNELPLSNLRLQHSYPSIDIVVFEFDGKNDSPSPFRFNPETPIAQGDTVYTAGFPKCGHLEISRGVVTSNRGFQLHSTIEGKHGSSGSPIFLANGALIGIVEEASSLIDAAKSMALNTPFELRGVQYDVVSRLLGKTHEQQIKIQADELLSYYMQYTFSLPEGTERFLEGMQLQARLAGLDESLLASAETDVELLRAIQNRSRYLGEILRLAPITWSSALAEQIELLTIASTIESNGMRQNLLSALSRSQIEEVFSGKERSELYQDILGKLLDKSSSLSTNGSLFYALAVGSKVALSFLLVLIVWLVSLGYVFGSYRGTVIGKIFVTLGVQILLWPISLLVFMLFRKK